MYASLLAPQESTLPPIPTSATSVMTNASPAMEPPPIVLPALSPAAIKHTCKAPIV